MSNLLSFFISFCAACVLIGSLYIICPEGNISKSVKYLLSLLFIVIIISCAGFTFSGKQISLPKSDIDIATEQELEIACARYVFEYVLRSNEINFEAVTVCTDKSPDGSIVINKVTIYTDCEKTKVLKALGELCTDREVEIINE